VRGKWQWREVTLDQQDLGRTLDQPMRRVCVV
jgi:hypothetical protein